MTRRFITMGLVAVLVAGGVGAGLGVIPHDGPPAAVAAPVPKQRGPVVWSAPLDLKETVTLRSTCGVWLPDGSGVLVPAPVKGKDGKRTPGGVEVRDAKTGEVVSRHAADVPEGGTFQAVAVGVSPDGSQVFAGGTVFTGKTPAHRLFTWKADTEKPELANDFGFPISAISGPPDGKTVSVVEAANAVVQLQLPSGAAFSAWSLNKKIYQAGVHHPSGKYILVVTESGTVAAAETKFGKMIGLMSYDAAFHAVAVSPDGSRIAAGGAPGKAKQSLVVIDEASDKTIGNNFRTFADAVPEKEAIHGLAFSRDGKHLAAACSDGLIRVFDTETGKLVTTSPREHDGPVYSLAYSPDGKKLLTLGKDAIRVWDVERLMNAK